MRRCNICSTVKPFSDFHVRRAQQPPYSWTCKPCANARSQAWRAAHPKAASDYYRQHKERRQKEFAEWRSTRKDHLRESFRRWAQANKGRVNALIMRRYAAKMRATPPWADHDAIRDIYAEAARLSAETGIRHDVDHIVPLQSPVVCGLHVHFNLQILTKAENIRKSNQFKAGHMPASTDLERINDLISAPLVSAPNHAFLVSGDSGSSG